MSDLAELTVTAASELIARKELSPVELVQALLDRIERVEPKVLAWARLLPEAALAEARRLEALQAKGEFCGPLHGVPIGLKDIIFTAGVETAAGSKVLAGFVPEYDATVTARLKAAGAIILGKTVTTEFAMFEPGPTRNPWNPEHTPGGSSSGSAAAVAARMCPAAFGSQTAGSILRPASYCGIVGLKPTYGRVSRHGVVPVSWTLDHVGPMVRTVADAALLLKVVAGPDPNDPTTLPVPVDDYPAAVGQGAAGLRVGIPDRFFTEAADDESRRAYEAAVTRLKELGLMLRPVRLPGVFEPLRDAHRTIMYAEAAAFHKKWFAERPDDYRPRTRRIIQAGMLTPAPLYLRAQQLRTEAVRAMGRLFEEVDVLVTPTTPGPAPRGLDWTGDPAFNQPFSAVGFPAITVPAGLSGSGLPLGVQFVARPFDEATLFRVAAAFEAAVGLRLKPPV